MKTIKQCLEDIERLKAESPDMTSEQVKTLDGISETLRSKQGLTLKQFRESVDAGTALVKFAELLLELFTNPPP